MLFRRDERKLAGMMRGLRIPVTTTAGWLGIVCASAAALFAYLAYAALALPEGVPIALSSVSSSPRGRRASLWLWREADGSKWCE